jgi:hypothetical protein
MPVRNQHPAQLTVLHLEPMPSATLPAGAVEARASAAYTSLFLAGSTPQSEFYMDGEILRTQLGARYGLGGGVEVGFGVPLLHTTGGFLDSFLIDYHDAFGFPDQGRSSSPRDFFKVQAAINSDRDVVYELREEGVMLGDVPLEASVELVPVRRAADGSGSPGLAARFGVELPTGDEAAGASNGEADYAVGLCATWPLSFGAVHAEAQHTFAGSPATARRYGFEFADVTAGSVSLEAQSLADLRLLAQVSWETATLDRLDLDRASKDTVLLWIGARLRLDGNLFLEVGFGEDLSEYIAPDFTAWLSMAWLPARTGLGPAKGNSAGGR